MTNGPLRWLTNKSLLLTVIVVWSILMTAVGYKVGVQHDYGYYLMHWDLVREGVNPWTHNDYFPPNTYGPAYNVLAYLVPIYTLLPKLLLIATFLMANFFLALKLVRSNPELSQTLLYLILVPLNFLVISVVSLFGDNDTLVAALVAFAILARFKNQFVAAGILLGLAVLLKYYPALIIPFFCLNDRRFNWRILVSSAITTAIGGLVAWLFWGSDFLFSLSFGATRDATYLSPLFAVKNHPEFATTAIVDFLTNNNTAIVLFLAVITFLLTYKLSFTWLEASATGLFVCLVAYKVGHAQYYLAWLVVLVGLVIQGDRRSKNLVYAFLPFVVLLEGFQFTYFIRMNGYWKTEFRIDQNVGTAVFVIAVATLLYIFLSKIREKSRTVTLV